MIGFEIRITPGEIQYAEAIDNDRWKTRRGSTEFSEIATQSAWAILENFIELSFESLTLHLEDVILVAFLHEAKPGHSKLYKVTAFDSMTGNVERAYWNSTELRAIALLALLGDDAPNSLDAYAFAEPLVKGWANECRPIP